METGIRVPHPRRVFVFAARVGVHEPADSPTRSSKLPQKDAKKPQFSTKCCFLKSPLIVDYQVLYQSFSEAFYKKSPTARMCVLYPDFPE
jgi:hypothetical protein